MAVAVQVSLVETKQKCDYYGYYNMAIQDHSQCVFVTWAAGLIRRDMVRNEANVI